MDTKSKLYHPNGYATEGLEPGTSRSEIDTKPKPPSFAIGNLAASLLVSTFFSLRTQWLAITCGCLATLSIIAYYRAKAKEKRAEKR